MKTHRKSNLARFGKKSAKIASNYRCFRLFHDNEEKANAKAMLNGEAPAHESAKQARIRRQGMMADGIGAKTG